MALTLKEAFRYQSYLDEILSLIYNYLTRQGNYVSVKKTHVENSGNSIISGEDKNVVDIDKLIVLIELILWEQSDVSKAISKTKYLRCNDLDLSIANNRSYRRFADNLRALLNVRDKSWKKNNIRYEQKPTFDRKLIKDKVREILKSCDEESTKIDNYISNSLVDITPKFDVYDSFEDLLERIS